jgi:ribonuclease-3
MKNRTEGDLSKFRAAIVCEQSLAEVSEKISLNKYIRLGKGEEMTGGRERPSIISDAFEAIIASIYLDGGIEAAREWVLSLMMEQIDAVLAGKKLKDYKTTLQEKVQKGHTGKVTYETIGESGEDHNKMFEVNVMIDGIVIASGKGRSKKDAEQQAAKAALAGLKR